MRPLPPISQFNKALGSILKMGHYATALSLIQNKLQQFQGIQVNIGAFNIAALIESILGCLFRVPSSNAYTPDVTTFTTKGFY
ncbi:hypothetical protein CsSME_00038467 [Camellia sinensis var. sinensis]